MPANERAVRRDCHRLVREVRREDVMLPPNRKTGIGRFLQPLAGREIPAPGEPTVANRDAPVQRALVLRDSEGPAAVESTDVNALVRSETPQRLEAPRIEDGGLALSSPRTPTLPPGETAKKRHRRAPSLDPSPVTNRSTSRLCATTAATASATARMTRTRRRPFALLERARRLSLTSTMTPSPTTRRRSSPGGEECPGSL
jgi:hypothetical protein